MKCPNMMLSSQRQSLLMWHPAYIQTGSFARTQRKATLANHDLHHRVYTMTPMVYGEAGNSVTG